MALEQLRNRIAEVLPENEIDAFFGALAEQSEHPRKSIRFNPLRTGAREFWLELGLTLGERIPWCAHGYWIDADQLHLPEAELFLAAGMGYVQEASAMEVVEALDLRPEENPRVLDLCAAPGGKSSQIGETLKGAGTLVSNEMDRTRVRLLDALLLRQGVSHSTVYSLFARDLADAFPQAFDRILVDAPCSSESFFAKRSDKRDDVSDSEVRRCSRKQRKILADAARMAAPGATLVYSTCTYSRDENEDVVDAFLVDHEGWRVLKTVRRFPHRDGVPGGFFAVLQAAGEANGVGRRSSALSRTRNHGLVREGLNRWNGESDLFAALMAGDREVPEVPAVELDTDAALRFCRGNPAVFSSMPASHELRGITWKGRRLGGVLTKNGKLESVLPKSLFRPDL